MIVLTEAENAGFCFQHQGIFYLVQRLHDDGDGDWESTLFKYANDHPTEPKWIAFDPCLKLYNELVKKVADYE